MKDVQRGAVRMTRRHHTKSEAETLEVARQLARELHPGAFVALRGGLGAGKTAFVRGLAGGLSLDEALVSSPTFALVNEYRQGSVALIHFDMYRVTDDDALYHTGFFDYLDGGGILAVEWSENIPWALPADRVTVTLSPGEHPNEREITIERSAAP